jgi:hypothetical protein
MMEGEKPPRGALSSMIVLEFGGEDRVFQLLLRQIDGLQAKLGAGIGTIAYRLSTQGWYTTDITETLFYGLVGGGASPNEARKIVTEWCDGRPLADPKDPANPYKTANAVLAAVFFGIPEDETRGKAQAATAMKAGSTLRPSMDKGSQSDSQSRTQQVYLSENGSPVDLRTRN